MEKHDILKSLESKLGMREVRKGFKSQPDLLSWGTEVAPLLTFNPQYYNTFLNALNALHLPLSSYTAGPLFRIMVSQVEMAIAQLRTESASEKEATSPSMRWFSSVTAARIGISLDS